MIKLVKKSMALLGMNTERKLNTESFDMFIENKIISLF